MTIYLDDGDVQLLHGDCVDVMATLGAGAVDAIVTSPPYADQRDYDAEEYAGRRGGRNRKSRNQRTAAPMEYVEEIVPQLDAMARVLSPAGSLMLNLGVIMRDGEESEYADEILRRARAGGWKLLHRIIWHKPNSIPLSHPTYLHIKHEWVFWLARSTAAYRGFDGDTRSPHSETSLRRIGQEYMTRKDERYMRRGKTHGLHPDGARPSSIVQVAVGGESGIKHPAIMPLALAKHLVSLSCPPGGVVLDPFAGSGTTLLAARQRGRRAIGIERSARYLPEAADRLKQLAIA